MKAKSADAQGDDFEDFVRAHGARLLRTAYLLVWDLASAEDLVQETLLKVAKRWRRVRAFEHRAAYARRVLVNLVLDSARRRSKETSELSAEGFAWTELSHAEAERALSTVEEAADLMNAVARLPLRQRTVLVLRYFEDLSEADTAEALGCSVGTVKSATSRALASLRRDEGVNNPRTLQLNRRDTG